jgi:hypothetical protein
MENLLIYPNNSEIHLENSKEIYQYIKIQEHDTQPNLELLKKIKNKRWIYPSRYHGLIYLTIQKMLLNSETHCNFGQYLIPSQQVETKDIEKMFNILNNIENENEEQLSYIVFFVNYFKFNKKKIWENENNLNFLDILLNKTSKISKECYNYLFFHYPEMKSN